MNYEFKSIVICKHAKEAWDILNITYEGTSTVMLSKQKMLIV